MLRFPIIPEACTERVDEKTGQILLPSFSGDITIDMPSFPERLRFAREMGMDQGSGEVTDADRKALRATLDQMELVAKVSEKIMPRVLEVNLKHLATGRQITTVEELYCLPMCGEVVIDLCMRFLLGFAEKN